MSSSFVGNLARSKALDRVNIAAQDDIIGTGQAHLDLLKSIRLLTLAAEEPNETLTRQRLEVGASDESLLARSVSATLS